MSNSATFQEKAKPNFLLVHGAWQGAWVWIDVIDKLKQAGFHAQTFDLPGSSSDPTSHDQVDLESYAEAIIHQANKMSSSPLVLVGHSMGGAAITAAAIKAPELFQQLIYVCAFLPQENQSIAMLAKESHEFLHDGPQVNLINNGLSAELKSESIAHTFFNDCTFDNVEHLIPLFKPQATKPITTPMMPWSSGFKSLKKTYIQCTLDNAIASSVQKQMATKANISHLIVLETGHEPFISQPDLLVNNLLMAIE